MKNPVLLAMSILAGAQALTAAANLQDLIGEKPAMLIVLAVAVIQAGVQFYVRGAVTPLVEPKDAAGNPLVRPGYRQPPTE